jgi:hypothetical protein
VGAWVDNSGNGNVATQATAGNKPTLKTCILQTHSVIRFVTDDVLTTAYTLPAAFTLFIVAANRTGTNGTFWSDDSGSGTAPLQRDQGGDVSRHYLNAGSTFVDVADTINQSLIGIYALDYTANDLIYGLTARPPTTRPAPRYRVAICYLGRKMAMLNS